MEAQRGEWDDGKGGFTSRAVDGSWAMLHSFEGLNVGEEETCLNYLFLVDH